MLRVFWTSDRGKKYRSSGDCSEESSGLMFKNHSRDTRYTGPLEVAPRLLSATYGTKAETIMRFCGGIRQDSVPDTFSTRQEASVTKKKSPTLRSGIVPATFENSFRISRRRKRCLNLRRRFKFATPLTPYNNQTLFRSEGIYWHLRKSTSKNSTDDAIIPNPVRIFMKQIFQELVDTSNSVIPCKNHRGGYGLVVEGTQLATFTPSPVTGYIRNIRKPTGSFLIL